MSGHGPLVQVLQHLFVQESRRSGASASQARAEAKTLIENVHVFARYHTEDNVAAPSNHAIIFDEAQRVLLPRARKGMFIFVPMGDSDDSTERPEEFEATAQYLIRCGVTPLI